MTQSERARPARRKACLAFAAVTALVASSPALAQNIRGDATGPTTAPGFSHPEQYIHLKDVKPADNMYPVIQHPEQDQAAAAKLAALAEKTGKKPNIMIFLLDDVGWMDPGFNGGGVAVGNATPVMDGLASEGLLLTSAYSTPSCSPTRATIHTGQNPLHHTSADVWRARRPRRRHDHAHAAQGARLRHARRGQVAYGRESRLAAAECRL
jgi:arylsulfatase